MSSRIERFQVKNNSIAFRLLTENLYQNKLKSILREIINNSYDSCITRNSLGLTKPDNVSDIHINFNNIQKSFTIRDYGIGLSKEDMTNLYTTYFQSTKTNDSKTVGGFGIGSKSPLALVNEFMSTSYYNGKKITLLIFLDSNDMPTYSIVEEADTSEPNGLEVSFTVPSNYDIEKVGNVTDNYMKIFCSFYRDIDIIYNGDKVEHIKLLETDAYDDIIIETYQSYIEDDQNNNNNNTFGYCGIRVSEVIEENNLTAIVMYKNNFYPIYSRDLYSRNFIIGDKTLSSFHRKQIVNVVRFKDESRITLALSREDIDNRAEVLNVLESISNKYFYKTVAPMARNTANKIEIMLNRIKSFDYVTESDRFDVYSSINELDTVMRNRYGYGNYYKELGEIGGGVVQKELIDKINDMGLKDVYITSRSELSRNDRCRLLTHSLTMPYYIRYFDLLIQKNGNIKTELGDFTVDDIIFRFNANYQNNISVKRVLADDTLCLIGLENEIKNVMVVVVDSCVDMSGIKNRISKLVGSKTSYFARVIYTSGEDRDAVLEKINVLKEESILEVETLLLENNDLKATRLKLGFDKENICYYSESISNQKIKEENVSKSAFVLCNKDTIASSLPYLGYIKNGLKELYIIDTKEEKAYKTLKEKYPDNDLSAIIDNFIVDNKLIEYTKSFFTVAKVSLLLTNKLHNLVLARAIERKNVLLIKEYLTLPKKSDFELFDKLKSSLSYVGYKVTDNSIFEEVEECRSILKDKKYVESMNRAVDLVYQLSLYGDYISDKFNSILSEHLNVDNMQLMFISDCPSDITAMDYIELDKDKKLTLKMLTNLCNINAISKLIK